jgi:hypothetical protein
MGGLAARTEHAQRAGGAHACQSKFCFISIFEFATLSFSRWIFASSRCNVTRAYKVRISNEWRARTPTLALVGSPYLLLPLQKKRPLVCVGCSKAVWKNE